MPKIKPYSTFALSTFICLLLLVSCKVTKKRIPKDELTTIQSQTISAPTIITYILKVSQTPNNTYPSVELYQKVAAKGYLKTKYYNKNQPINGNFVIELINTSSTVVQAQHFPHPLLKSYEFTDEEGHFSRKEISLQEEFISIRTQKAANITHLRIYMMKEKKQVLLQKIKV